MSPGVNLNLMLQDKRLLIFDFDGTLADTSVLHAQSFTYVLRPYMISVDYASIAGLRTDDALVSCLSNAGVRVTDNELARLVSLKQAHVRGLIAKELESMPGVDAFLRWARPRYRLALYSSGSRGTVKLALEKLGYVDWFDPVVCAEDVQHAKPAPEGYVRVLQLTAIQPSDALVFEDSDAGVIAAQAAGIPVVCVGNNSKQSFSTEWNTLLEVSKLMEHEYVAQD